MADPAVVAKRRDCPAIHDHDRWTRQGNGSGILFRVVLIPFRKDGLALTREAAKPKRECKQLLVRRAHPLDFPPRQ
jgi:hypothetical protein